MSYSDPIGYKAVVARLENTFEEVYGQEFYAELFPHNECRGDMHTDFSAPNALFLWRDGNRQRRRVMLADTWEEDYLSYVYDNTRALCSGLVYRGRANKLANAQKMNALIFDLDGVGDYQLVNLLFYRFGKPYENIGSMPMPTFLVASGTGLHIYYVLENPIDLYPSVKEQLKNLKNDLTYKLWDWKSTSTRETVQYQGISQTFRMVGSINEKYGNRIRAFRTGGKVSLETLNEYTMYEGSMVNLSCHSFPGATPLVEAKKKWPVWYQETVIEGKKKEKGRWDISGKVHGSDPYALYHWWIRHAGQIKGGHRYFFMFCMVAYARKCDVPFYKLKEDMREVFERLKEVEHISPLTKEDMDSALKAWKRDFFNFRLSDIEKLSGLRLPRNKRNGRKQAVHLAGARAIQKVNDEFSGSSWRDGNGRKPKESIVKAWRKEHPNGRKADCIRDTGLSKPTVYKWW